MNDSAVIHVMNPSTAADDEDEKMRMVCSYLRITPEEWALIRQAARQVGSLNTQCRTVTQRCATLEHIQKQSCCPANMNYSAVTINKYSHQNQVNVNTIVTGLGAPYVDTYPVNPGSRIRLIQEARPGYSPKKMTVAFNLANQGTNFSDLEVSFYITTDPKQQGEKIGSDYRGFQFFNNQGQPTPIDFPTYQQNPLTIGTHEWLVVEIAHQGPANNLVSAFVAAYVNAEGWFAACGESPPACGTTC